MLGVLGGMGPLATADFLTKLILLTPARVDADHIPLVVSSEPHIPTRILGIADDDPDSPLAAMLERRDLLIKAGVRAIAMPCNTAHYWHADLAAGLDIPFLHIVEAVVGVLENGHPGATIGLMGTKATLQGRLYEDPIRERGFDCLIADADLSATHIIPGIALVKENRIPEARALLRQAVERLLDAGAEKVVLGCTELPVGLDMNDAWVAKHCIDPTAALAQACVDWAMAAR
jgi:aspartate racemase